MNASLTPLLLASPLNEGGETFAHTKVEPASAMMTPGAHPSDAGWWALASEVWHRTDSSACLPAIPAALANRQS